MADYRERYAEIHAAGASVAAVSVDAPAKSEAVRVDLCLPFPILCDTEHRVVREWGIYNSAEKGGLAKPAVFIIDTGRVIRYAAVDSVVRRVSVAGIVSLLHHAAEGQPVRRTFQVPIFSQWKSAFGNFIKR